MLQAQRIEHRVQQARFKIRIAHGTEAGHLACTVQLFRIAPALHLVDWRREQGDVRAYHAFYMEQRALLGDLVAPG